MKITLKISHRFVLLLILLVVSFSIYGILSFKTLNHLKVNGPVYQRIVEGKDLIGDILPPPEYIIESYLTSLQLAEVSSDERKQLIEKLTTLKKEYDERHEFWGKANLENALKDQLAVADKPVKEFYRITFDQFIPALEKDDKNSVKTALVNMKQHYNLHRQAINRLVDMTIKRNEADEANARDEIFKSSVIMLAILLGAISVMSIFLFFIARNLLRQLGGEPFYAADVVGQIASGNLATHIDIKSGDGASLLFSIKAMRNSLTDIIAQVRSGTDTIATASRQIASGNLDLSSRTEQQAGALEETASSIEELTSTVKQNADNAQQANKLAISASEIAQQGGSVISQVIDTMGSINDSSKRIVDIIAVIEGIAFQTNILALNAAVEAARAGEQGRGFAVVASEVRSLAQRSAGAAKEIKSLIDVSVEKVDAGAKLVDKAGATMQAIVDSIKSVTDIVGEISAASQEQTSGIDQINRAITQMDTVTQQNAALVEEAAAASQAMQDQAGYLSQVVSVFKIGETGTPIEVSLHVMTCPTQDALENASIYQKALTMTDGRTFR